MRAYLLALVCGLSACASGTGFKVAADPACALAAADERWMSEARGAWRLVSREVLHLPQPGPAVAYVLYDARCTYRSTDGAVWTGSPHGGMIGLPDGGEMPPVVASFATPADDGKAMMVMALPTVWRAGGVSADIGVEALMFSVFAHELSHTYQFPLFNSRFDALEGETEEGDDLTDDVIQERFAKDAAFADSVNRERELLFAAASEPDEAKARGQAGEAVALMRARRAQWLTGQNATYGELEDLFLTMEGAGQYAAYAWLAHPEGGASPREQAVTAIRRGGKWWSQDLGLAIYLVLDRFQPSWAKSTFTGPARTAISLLDEVWLAADG